MKNLIELKVFHVLIYIVFTSSWLHSQGALTQIGLDIDGVIEDAESGYSVSLSSDGNVVAIGAPSHSPGYVRVYELIGGVWVQRGSDTDIQGVSASQFGLSVLLSSDGKVLAIGAPNADNGSTASAGLVRVYEWSGSAWVKRGEDIYGVSLDDKSSSAVSLSSDGSLVAIGAPFNDDNGSNSGHVRVFEFGGGAWMLRGSAIPGEDANDYSGVSVSLSSDGRW